MTFNIILIQGFKNRPICPIQVFPIHTFLSLIFLGTKCLFETLGKFQMYCVLDKLIHNNDRISRFVRNCIKCFMACLTGYRQAVKTTMYFCTGESPLQIRKELKDACKKARIKYGRFVKGGFIFHDLRHTFNTNMRKAGIAESVIMKITGHSTREMFDRYNTVDEDDTRKAVKKLEGFLQVLTKSLTRSTETAKIENKESLKTPNNR